MTRSPSNGSKRKHARAVVPRSALPDLCWPALPDAAGARMLALQYQLEQTQWWSPADLERQQMRQLQLALRRAYDSIPFWRERLDAVGFDAQAALTQEWLSTLPLLTRDEVRTQGTALLCRSVPPEHGRVGKGVTSGSVGKPIVYFGTDLTQFFWRACTLRDHLWHQRDFAGKLAASRTKVEDKVVQGWGLATDVAFETGPCAVLNIRADIDDQLAWLKEQDPDYLITHPSTLRALVQRAEETGFKPERLREVRTFGETLPSDLRGLCAAVWDVKLTDIYTAEEVGYIALQCPESERYHVQAENLRVEILNDAGKPCEHGEIGRVVVTTLHNFAMPLIRYEIGDYAQAGAPCACGRGLPVIERVMGRSRNLVTLPDGSRHWPFFSVKTWADEAPVRQLQLVQHDLTHIEVKLVADRELNEQESGRLVSSLHRALGYPFRISLTYVAEIGRSANFKYEDFVSLL